MIKTPEAIAITRHIAESNSHTVVDGLAGTGKTTVFADAFTALDPTIYPEIWVTSHNTDIVKAISARLPVEMYVKGIHAVGYGSLHFNFRPSTTRNYVVPNKYEYILRDILPEYIKDNKSQHLWSNSLQQLWDLCRTNMVNPKDVVALKKLAQHYTLECPYTLVQASEILQLLEKRGKKEVNYRVDFTDMMWLPVVLGLSPTRKFKHAIADEVQDFTPLHMQLFLQFSDGARRHIIGDYNQAIYSFMGASGDAINILNGILSATDIGCVRLPLSVCWRCPTSHLDLVREIIPHIKNAPNAKVGAVNRTTKHQLLKQHPPKPGSVCITRTNRPGIDMCLTLTSMGIPSRMAGKDINRFLIDLFDKTCKSPMDFQRGYSATLDKYIDSKVSRLSEEEGNDMAIASILDRGESLRQLYYSADEQNITNPHEFRKYISDMFVGEDEMDDNNVVYCSTVHKFKGREADHIYILNPENIRHPKAKTKLEKQQEINIDYIARSRSKDTLTYVSEGQKVESIL